MTNPAYEATKDNQRRAADPAISAFVSANAGSGKTRVLTNRVARLLLAGARPERILCITFTKAAAAQMAERLFDLLGTWALVDDAALRAGLDEVDPAMAARFGPDDFARARKLFAMALETPGGLKIQTIHSFCESVLKRFPLEAGVSPGFRVIEGADADALIAASVDGVLSRTGRAFTAAKEELCDAMTIRTLTERLSAAVGDRRLARAFAAVDYAARPADILDIEPEKRAEDYEAEAVRALDDDKLARAISALSEGSATAKGMAEALRAAGREQATAGRYRAYCNILLTQKGEARQAKWNKKILTAHPGADEAYADAQAAFIGARDKLLAAEAARFAGAFATLVKAAASDYAEAKRARAVLDFADLIEGAERLFSAQGRAEWVMYKLDRGLEHILLDEAQDTSPEAWRVIEGPLTEFFAGEGAIETRPDAAARSFFAVGDQKQSIYSFQGADAALFHEKAQDLGKRIEDAQAPFANVPLDLSFRTSAPVLAFVDALFADRSVLDGVSADEAPLSHGVFRDGAPGLVELWPLKPRPEREPVEPWDAPLDARGAESPPRVLAEEVAATIKAWLDDGLSIGGVTERLTPGDVMILVQSRGELFHEMIRALSAAGLPVAGADRLALLEDQAVKDLLSAARAAVFTGDDLALAETLKSPLCGVDDDALFHIAYGREGRLCDALRLAAGEDDKLAEIVTALDAARDAANDGPFAFFTHLLETGTVSGRKRLYTRLGAPAREPIDALLSLALDFEKTRPRNLRLFLAWVMARGAEVKRDAEAGGDVIRVMTVHQAKGLEARVVFLLDAHRGPLPGADFLQLDPGRDKPLLPVPKKPGSTAPQAVAAAAECAKRKKREEYRRLLYVAATRAEDALIICGHETGKTGQPHKPAAPDKVWWALAEDAFGRLGENVHLVGEKWGAPVRRIEQAREKGDKPAHDAPGGPTPIAPLQAPDWLFRAASAERRDPSVSPSRLADLLEATAGATSDSIGEAYAPAGGRYARGLALHRLLELLPDVAPDARRAAADRLLARLAAGETDTVRAEWREEVMQILEDPRFAPVFGPRGRAEVPLAGRLTAYGGLKASGQIDRLLVTQEEALIVDYKTNRPPPARVEETPAAYLAQMGAYRALVAEIFPGRRIRAALLWTFAPRLMALPEALMTAALERSLSRTRAIA